MALGLVIEFLLHCAMLLPVESESPIAQFCVNKKFCSYQEIQQSPLLFDIICPSAKYKEIEIIFTCFKSSKEHTIRNAVLRFRVPTEVEHDLLNDLYIINLEIKSVSNTYNLAFDRINSLKTIKLEDGNMREIPLSIRSLKHLTSLSLINQKLETLPNFAFQEMESLTKLVLSSNSVSTIGQYAFQGLDTLTELDLSHNNLTGDVTSCLRNLPALIKLNLGSNKISELISQAFLHLTSLRTLDLYHNQIFSLNDNTFAGLTELRVLSLFSNNLISVPSAAFKNLPKLEKLYINDNPIIELKAVGFYGLKMLKTIWIGSKSISFIHEDAFAGLDNLTGLSLEGSKLTSIPVLALKALSKLEWLHLGNNQITEWKPSELSTLTLLKNPYLGGNKFVLNQDAFAGFDGLNGLGFANLNLTSVPTEAIKNLSKLTWLDLNTNKLTKLEQNSFMGLHSLKRLWLYDNQISTIHSDAFVELEESLEYLDLSNNQLIQIPVGALQNIKKLTEVSFGNLIEFVEANTFKAFGETIEIINLNGNRIKSFGESAFSHLPNLKLLNLQNNQLQHLDFVVVYPIVKQNINFKVNGNPLMCNCELYWYYELSHKPTPAFYSTWFADHQNEHNLDNNECINNGTILHLEQECQHKWKPIMCNATSVYGCMSGDSCKDEVGC